MIFLKINGGLGNQLFQYALGRKLAHKHKTELKLDISNYKNDIKRKYLLNNFNIKENFASLEEINYYKRMNGKLYLKLFETFKPYRYKKYINQFKNPLLKILQFHFNPKVLELGPDVYLDGYWQSEKYFKNITDILKEEFKIKRNIPIDKTILNQIKQKDTIALHIRRGDYVEDENTKKTHGFIGLNYYQKAIKYILTKIEYPHFFLFTDDVEWASCHFSYIPNINIVSKYTNNDIEDFIFLQNCNHYIIANSTFSWWGAWLSNCKNKIVIAPKNWLKDKRYKTKDIIPERWIKI